MSTGKKRSLDFGAMAARQVSRDLQAASAGPDRFERAQAALAGPATVLDVDAIVARQQSTRETDAGHVKALAESIAALGLIEPIVVDASHRLLAGGHRLDAIKALRAESPDVFAKWFAAGVPVRTMEFDAEAAPDRALEIEIAENEHRRDYTVSQVKELVARLRDAGYRDTVGRPSRGERALGPALEVIVGKSMKTIRKLLTEGVEAKVREPATKESTLVTVRKALEKQRPLIPEGLLCHLDALVSGLDAELQGRQGA